MRLRARLSGTAVALQSPAAAALVASSSLSDLKRVLVDAFPEALTSIPLSAIKIKTGFPPKEVLNSDTDSLAQCGISNGEQLFVEVTPVSDNAWGGIIEDETAQVLDGYFTIREMKDDNSCLFHSMKYIFDRHASVDAMRNMVATHILEHHLDYSEAVLGKSIAAYTAWIKSPSAWGGAIELSVFSRRFSTEIWSVDVSRLRIDKFGEDLKYSRVCVVFYSGIHYDVGVVTPVKGVSGGAVQEFDTTVFDRKQSDELMAAVLRVAEVWKRKHKFTSLSDFTLRCEACKVGLKGQAEAQEHALRTGHAAFVEFTEL
ncbi:aminotransferase [Entophlyctis luteolus]|nr:aminotransferase [Entophlyctis luteolus]KAJ3352741.1 aminotransferase [Entophlyctis luteolus]KAJ3388874.1 aminotransferase [Entophlyctis sp. JEL0112]